MKIKNTLVLACLTTVFSFSFAQDSRKFDHTVGSFVDPRDGKEYKTITFIKHHHGTDLMRTWYAENVRFEVEGSVCYNDIKEYCDKYGRLYNYEQANKACPEGWHVPTLPEWKLLFEYFGGRHHTDRILMDHSDTDMNMVLGGFGEPGPVFQDITSSGNWWDNELKDSNTAGIISLKKDTHHVFHSVVGDRHLLSSRCVHYHN